MKAIVNKELCEGCSICVDVCPDVYELDDNDQAYVKVDPIPDDIEAECRDAADQCPTQAIEIEEA